LSLPRSSHAFTFVLAVDQDLLDESLAALSVADVRELATGGQKTVRLVDRDGEQIVMKVIALESGSIEPLRRAQREVELLQAIDNEHVVKVVSELVELGDPIRGVAWLEEHLDGEDLSDLFGGQWDWNATRAMALQVADGLSAIHETKVVHRDLSASNVRQTNDGRFVVMDPGFARHTLRSGLTIGGQPGTYGFLSPEHLGSYSGVPTAASDVFCLGILMFIALTGQQPIPFTGDPSDYLARLARVEVVDIQVLRNDLTDEQTGLMRRMLHPQSARRPRNGAMVVAELAEIE
jgi:eukaryotic-like serine/threonine-protein kinase